MLSEIRSVALPQRQRRSKHLIQPPGFTVLKDKRGTKGNYLCRFYLGGKNHYFSTFKTEKRAAEKEAEVIVLQRWEEWKALLASPRLKPSESLTVGFGPAPAMDSSRVEDADDTLPSEPKVLAIADAVEEWLAEYGLERPRSLRNVTTFFKSWTTRYPYRFLTDMTPENLAELQKRMMGELSKQSNLQILTYLKRFLQWCVSRRYLADSPATAINPQAKGTYGGVVRNKDVWTEEFFREFIEHFQVSEKRALRAYWHTGIDLCDISRIERKHIKPYADGVQYIEIGRLKAKDQSSNSKEIIRFPLTVGSEIQRLVVAALKTASEKKRDYLFNPKGLDPNDFTSALSRKRTHVFAKKFPDMKVLTWKALRYTFFTRCRNAGIPDAALVRWGGWVDASMLYKIYDKGVTTAQHTGKLIQVNAD